MSTTKTDSKPSEWDKKELGCLWRRESKNGEKYLTGVLSAEKLSALLASGEDVQIICFTNKQKQKDTHPDLRIYISEKKTAPAAPTAPTPPAKKSQPFKAPTNPTPPPSPSDVI